MKDPEDHVENETYVRSVPQSGVVQMYLPEEYQYERPSEVLAGMKEIVEKIYNSAERFLIMNEVEWAISDYGPEYPDDSVIKELRDDDDITPPDVRKRTVSDDSLDGDRAIAVLEELVQPLNGPWYPIEVTFDGRTKLYIDNQWQMVGADTPGSFKAETASPHREQRFEDPDLIAEGPISINVHRTAVLTDGWELAYTIHIRLNTDVWNEDTTTGNVNSEQLEAFLARLYAEFNVAEVHCEEGAQNSLVEGFVDPDHMG